ncbi:STAS domain-containing protein [Oceanobacillus luteolus]|uniref:STAS domain-containing protein n=1 Tax=Oceanobacillus luteolus TaxID=1274358 RepID=A0ABW4HPQ0_9BACI|nr:STAS domain-containing protein [Oceanobacillus luteolus]MCM3742231.1 STAS domain-containing protein [Oceanobacillus luteolus]
MVKEDGIAKYIQNNEEEFQSILLKEAGDVASKIHSILEEGNIDLLSNAKIIALYVVGNKRDELIAFAEVEGISWAKHSLTLALKLEWIHAIRRTLWRLLRKNSPLNVDSVDEFFALEKRINDGIDEFLNNFFISYSRYKDELLIEQRKLVEHLTVPIIPVSSWIAVLPLIGKFDSYRMETIEEKALSEISRLDIETLIIDLSGIPDIDEYTLDKFEKVVSGIKLMGSEPVLTGLMPNLAHKMASLGANYGVDIAIKGTLQRALNEYLFVETS